MAINNKFVHFKTSAKFQEQLEAGNSELLTSKVMSIIITKIGTDFQSVPIFVTSFNY